MVVREEGGWDKGTLPTGEGLLEGNTFPTG